jgi:integrase/recombinase XerC
MQIPIPQLIRIDSAVEVVPVDEYRSVLAEIDRSTLLGKRDYAICRLLWDNALRRGEIVSLDRSNFIPQESRLMILGKGTLELQSIDLNPAVVTAINDYLPPRESIL